MENIWIGCSHRLPFSSTSSARQGNNPTTSFGDHTSRILSSGGAVGSHWSAVWTAVQSSGLGYPTIEVKLNEQITHLEQSKHDPNLWLLKSPQTAELLAILTIYVDDLLLSGTPEASTAIWKAIKEKWKISEPEFADEGQGITFCGFEIRQDDQGLHVGQSKYVQSLLDKYSEVTGVTSAPYAKESEPVCKPQDSLEKLRRAQGLVGELLWLATRTRADLVYGVSRIGQLITRDVDQAIQRAEDMIRYLKSTKHQEVRYGIPGEGHGPGSQLPVERDFNLIEVFADASFCPGSDRSQTGIVLMWGNAPIGWMSMRQPCASLSTAEAELQASLDGMTLAEGLHGLLSELAEAYHVPGKYMLGDLCTKPLLGPRIKELLSMMSVTLEKPSDADGGESDSLKEIKRYKIEPVESSGSGGDGRVEQALRAITAASLIDGVASKLMKIQVEIEEEKNQLDEIFDLLKYLSAVLVLVGLIALVAWKCWKRESVDAPKDQICEG
ncbi:RE2, partial [Symbiodinium necroappetens]